MFKRLVGVGVLSCFLAVCGCDKNEKKTTVKVDTPEKDYKVEIKKTETEVDAD